MENRILLVLMLRGLLRMRQLAPKIILLICLRRFPRLIGRTGIGFTSGELEEKTFSNFQVPLSNYSPFSILKIGQLKNRKEEGLFCRKARKSMANGKWKMANIVGPPILLSRSFGQTICGLNLVWL